MFGQVLKEPYAQSVIRYHGFRSGKNVPDKFPASTGLATQLLRIQLRHPPIVLPRWLGANIRHPL